MEKDLKKLPCDEKNCSYARRMQSILNATSDLVIILNTKSQYISFEQNKNRSDLYKPPSEWLGKYQHEVLPRKLNEQFQAVYDKVLQGSEHENLEYTLQVMDGSTRNFLAIVTPVFNENGEVVELCSVIRDITQKKVAQDTTDKTLKFLSGRELVMMELKEEIKKLKSGKDLPKTQ